MEEIVLKTQVDARFKRKILLKGSFISFLGCLLLFVAGVFFPIKHNLIQYLRAYLYNFFDILIVSIINVLPDYYKEFYIEKEMNKKTTKQFICDYIKNNLLLIIGSMCYYSLLILVLNNTGKFFYIYAMVISVLFILFALTIFPTLIAPFFFTYVELADEKLK